MYPFGVASAASPNYPGLRHPRRRPRHLSGSAGCGAAGGGSARNVVRRHRDRLSPCVVACKRADGLSFVEPVGGFEPLTVRLQGASGSSLGIAEHGFICRLAAGTVAGYSPASPGCCLRWLPVWLPSPRFLRCPVTKL